MQFQRRRGSGGHETTHRPREEVLRLLRSSCCKVCAGSFARTTWCETRRQERTREDQRRETTGERGRKETKQEAPEMKRGEDCEKAKCIYRSRLCTYVQYQAQILPRSHDVDATTSATCPAKFRIEKLWGYLPESVPWVRSLPGDGALGSFVTFPGPSGPVLLSVR